MAKPDEFFSNVGIHILIHGLPAMHKLKQGTVADAETKFSRDECIALLDLIQVLRAQPEPQEKVIDPQDGLG